MSVTFFLLVASIGLFFTKSVAVKMLPFDNKNEIQVMIDPPEGTTLEATDAIVRQVENLLITMPEVTEYVSTVGTASPMDFNGLVRHYYMREGANVADIRVNLLPRSDRQMSSHAIVLRLRKDLEKIVEAGLLAPSGKNIQTTRFIIVNAVRHGHDGVRRQHRALFAL